MLIYHTAAADGDYYWRVFVSGGSLAPADSVVVDDDVVAAEVAAWREEVVVAVVEASASLHADSATHDVVVDDDVTHRALSHPRSRSSRVIAVGSR